jgi:tol-pal system protein YbgF
MRLSCIRPALAAVLLTLFTATPVLAVSKQELEMRIDSLERKVESRSLVDMLNRIEQLQGDVQQLRGEIEVQSHTLEDMQRRQRELYLDIDRRLQQLESGQRGQPIQPLAPSADVPVTAPPPLPATGRVTAPPPTTPPPPMAPPPADLGRVAPPPAPSGEEQAEYEKALAILREGRYADAATVFSQFLTRYPGSTYADNASYWLGETYYVSRDFDRALASFGKLVENYPQSPKLPDARLKIGFIHYEKKDWASARRELDGLVADHPGSTAARLAADRLVRMKKEGH